MILSLLKKINKEFGTTILCNLHQVDLAKKYSDRIVGLIDGKVIFDEKSTDINNKLFRKNILIIMNKKTLELKVNNKEKNFEKYLKPQWSLQNTYFYNIILFCSYICG